MWWNVRAESDAGQVITFGLRAVARDRAYLTALERLPWSPRTIDLQLVPLSPATGGITFAEHQAHGRLAIDCRFCAA